jgi:hypothetical protein
VDSHTPFHPFLNLSPERFAQFTERLTAVVRRINRTPRLSQAVTLVVEAVDELDRPMRVVVWQDDRNAPWGTFTREKLRVESGRFLVELKRDLFTTEFFRGYP